MSISLKLMEHEYEQSQTSGWNLHYFGDINQKGKLFQLQFVFERLQRQGKIIETLFYMHWWVMRNNAQ